MPAKMGIQRVLALHRQMSTFPPKAEARRRPVSVLALKLWEMAEALEERLDSPIEVLEVLVNSAAKGEQAVETWERLHEAAERFERTADLALAYEQVTQDKRIKLLPPEQQAFIFLQATGFFARLGDTEGAAGYAERAISAVPGHPEAFAQLEALLTASGKLGKLSQLYLDASQREADAERRLALIQRAFSIGVSIDNPELVIEAGQRLLKLTPEDAGVREEVMRRLLSGGRHKEVVELLEQVLAGEPPPPPDEAKLHREQLVDLCFTVLKSPERALNHIEGLLRLDPAHQMAQSAAESLLENKQLMLRAAAALSDAFERSQDIERAVAMLTFELRHVRGLRRIEVQRRLGILRQDALNDPAGALELLAPVVAGDPGDDDLRRRFVELSLSLNQPAETARLLSRALQSHRDPAVRARVGVDVGDVYLKSGDVKRAQAAFQKVLETEADDRASLAAAHRLTDLSADSGDLRQLSNVLTTIVRLEPEKEPRQAAARRLARLSDGEVPDPERAILAYRALVGSPWTDEALTRLEALYTEAGDDVGLSDVLAFRAERCKDPEQARDLAARSLELRTARTRDPESAIQAYASFIQTFGATREVHARLLPLLEQTGRFSELAEVLERELALAAESERAKLWLKLANVRATRLADPAGALDALARALSSDPGDRAVRTALEKLLTVPEVRLAAANLLEPLYANEEPSAGLLRVLEARADAGPDVGSRLQAAERAVALAETLRDPERALEIAARALADSVASAPEAIDSWLMQVQRLGASSHERRARLLFNALGGRSVDSRSLFDLARATGDAAQAAGDLPHAIEVYRQALSFDPSSRELVQAIDTLLAQQGSPSERLSLYEAALAEEREPQRRRDLLHAMARLQRVELKDALGATVTLRRAVAEEPRDLAAHDALLDALNEAGDFAGAAMELERVLPLLEGDRRSFALLRLAEAAERAGNAATSLARYRELLECADLSDDVLANVERLALEQADGVTLRSVLEQRLLGTSDPQKRVQLLERLGNAASWQLGDAVSAARFWLEGARLSEGAALDRVRARRLYDRVLDADPKNREAAERLLELCAQDKDWIRLGEAFAIVLDGGDERDIVSTLLGLEAQALETGSASDFVALVDLTLARDLEPQRARQLVLGKARALGTLPDRADEAAQLFRGLIESARDSADSEIEAFAEFLKRNPARKDDVRWLFRFRAQHSADAVSVLLDWARCEEQELGDPAAARKIYERVTALDPEQTEAWTELARLQAAGGDPSGALASLEALHSRVEGDVRSGIDLRIAGLMIDSLGRASEALQLVRPLIEKTPSDLDVLRIVHRALALPETRAEAAQLLEQAAEAFDDPARRADVIEALLAVSAEAPELTLARSRWLTQLLETKSDAPEEALRIALRGAEAAPGESELWKVAEQMARRLDNPTPVVEAYSHAFERNLPPAVASELGERMVEFYGEWFDEPERVIQMLRRVLELSPEADWAFDRLKLAFNGAGRWQELFALYDARLAAPLSSSARIELLREAAMAARDFAADSERAIHYLELLNRENPGDTRVEASLERLYERHAKRRPLIDLLSARLANARPADRSDLLVRISSLWLDLTEPEPALELCEELLKDPERVNETVQLLERLITLPPSATRRASQSGAQVPLLRATAHLTRHYRTVESTVDVVRMLELEESVAETAEERRTLLEEIVKLRLDVLGDALGAFETTAELVLLDPDAKKYRPALAELAQRVGLANRRAEVLVLAARKHEAPELRASLLNEAAAVQRTDLGAPHVAAELYRQVMALPEAPPKAELEAARNLSRLLEEAGDALERVSVLERLADLAPESAERRTALGVAARLSFEALHDAPRAIAAYRKRLADDLSDLEAMNGLCQALEAVERWDELISALEARAAIEPDVEARADRERIAELHASTRGDRATAIEAWRRVVALHGGNDKSFGALRELLFTEQRWGELSELFNAEIRVASAPEPQRSLLLELGELHEQRTNDRVAALEAYVAALDWQSAIRVAGAHPPDRDTGRRVCARLLQLATSHWQDAGEGPESDSARTADWALTELAQRLQEDGEYETVVKQLLAAAKLPFATPRRRDLRREAACLVSDRLGDAERAIELFNALLSEDPGDEVAVSSVTRLALLLEEKGRFAEIVALWETQATARGAQGDVPAAQVLWARAGELAEHRLNDEERALADYGRGAELGGEACLEALARIHQQAGRIELVAQALERLCQESSADALGQRALALAEAYVTLGKPQRAQDTLERAVSRVVEGAPLRARLATLYRQSRDFTRLARLVEEEANRAADNKQRLVLLREAAELHLDQRGEPGPAVPLLMRAIEIDGDDSALRLLLARALYEERRYTEAAGVLREQLARYGSRRPKDRALVHFQLARALLAADDRVTALDELDAAAKIDPAHPSILEMLARTALEQGELDRAERMFRALLLVAGKDPANPTSRAEALFALGEVAEARGDSSRAEEFTESAFEAAAENSREAFALERALAKRKRVPLLARALELRLSEDLPLKELARVLSELAEIRAADPDELSEARGPLLERAYAAEARLDEGGSYDDSAWAALGRTYVALGDAAAENRVLERRIEASARSSRPPPDGDLLYRLAAARLANGSDLEGGLDLLERALSLSPDFERAESLLRSAVPGDLPPRAALLLERIARERGDARALLTALERRVAAGDADIVALREGVTIAEQLSEPGLAARLLQQAIETEAFDAVPEQASFVRLELARYLRQSGDIAAALDSEESALPHLEGEQRRELLYSLWRAAENDPARAARCLEALRAEDPENPDLYRPLLELYRAQGEVEHLAELLDSIAPLVSSAEERTALRLERVELLLSRLDRRDEAIRLLQEVVRDAPGERAARLTLAELLAAEGREDELLDLLSVEFEEARQAEDVDSVSAIALRLATLLQRRGRASEAFDICQTALALEPQRRELLELNVRLAKATEEPERLAEAFERLLSVEHGPSAAALCRRLLKLREELGDTTGAERALELGFAACPSDVELCDELCRRLEERGDHEHVAEILARALKERPDDRALLERLLASERARGNLERALEIAERYLQRHPDDTALRRARAGLLSEIGRDTEAIEELEQAAQADVSVTAELVAALERALARADAQERSALGLRLIAVLEHAGDVDAARERLIELSEAQPNDRAVLERLASLESTRGNLDGAIEAYSRLGELSSGDELTSAALALARLCAAHQRSEAARPLLERALASNPSDPELRAALVSVLEQSGAHRELAVLLLQQALEQAPGPERVPLLLRAAELSLAGDDFDTALSALESARSDAPDSIDAAVLIARAYTRAGRLDQALAHLGALLDGYKGKRLRSLAAAYEEKANVHLEEGFLTDALVALGKAFEMDPKNARIGIRLGKLAFEAEEEEVAQRALRSVAIMKTADVDGPDGARPETKADANYALALLAQRAQDPRKAKILAAKAISENPAHEAARALLAQLDRR
ncbi:MAG: tetratricopeptide repeat protein [Myxococcota bacterium]